MPQESPALKGLISIGSIKIVNVADFADKVSAKYEW